MKTSLLCFAAFISFFLSNGQTLTQSANEPAPGDKEFSYFLDTTAYNNGLPNNISGNGVTWNYTQLQAIPPMDTTFYSAPSAVPGATAFPGCTVVQEGFLNVFIKSVSSPTPQTEILGVKSGTLNLTFTNTAVAARFPVSFGSHSTDNLAGTYTALGYNGPCSGVITTTADGLGTLQLPDNYSFSNVLRVRSVQTVTLYQGFLPIGTAVQTIYNFYSNTQKFPLLSVNYTAFSLLGGNPTITGFVAGSANAFVTGIKENGAAGNLILLYPNPSSPNFVHVKLPSNFSNRVNVSFYNLAGQEVLHQELSPEFGTDQVINLKTLARGLYTVTCRGESLNYVQHLVVE